MVADILKTPSVQRLAGILQSRYGKTLEVRFIVDANAGTWGTSQYSVTQGDLYIPISVHETFLGLAKVPGVQDLADTSVAAIADVVKLVLEPALYRRYLDARFDVIHSQGFVEAGSTPPAAVKNDSPKAVLLHSRNPHHVSNLAFTLHEETGRWAFLRYSDMNNDFGNTGSLESLGKATIFIEDVLQISPAQWGILKDFLLTSNPDFHPLILLGTNRSWTEWHESGEMDHDILDLVAPYTAELDRWPTARNLAQEAFRMLLKPAADNKS